MHRYASILPIALLLGAAPALAQGADDCASAQVIAGTGGFAFDNNGATNDGTGPGCVIINSNVWFEWTAPNTSSYIIDTCGQATLDTALAVWDGSMGCYTAELGCNDDFCGLQSSVSFATTAGQSYLIEVGSWDVAAQDIGSITISEDVPVLNPNNGHYYRSVITGGNFDWNTANSEAQAAMWLGQAGHLATISDQAELDWIVANAGISRPWIGGFHNPNNPNYMEPDLGWEWVTGEPMNFTNWFAGEPNNTGPLGGPEDHMEMFGSGEWNDSPNPHTFTDSYLIEWDSGGLGTNYCASTINSSGGAATLTAVGSETVADQNLSLRSQPVPDNVFGIHYYGPNQLIIPFGSGFRCVGGAIQRLPFDMAVGDLLETVVDFNIPQAAGIVAGTLNFQGWFRDQADPNGYQLSDGLEIVFQ